jgi:hypothetical protein
LIGLLHLILSNHKLFFSYVIGYKYEKRTNQITLNILTHKVALRAKIQFTCEETMRFCGYEPEENGGYSAYDEYHGIFGPISTFAGASGFAERSSRRSSF